MSYNITLFKVKELDNFVIPVASLYKNSSTRYHPEKKNNNDRTTTFSLWETEIQGTICDDLFLLVKKIDCFGDVSGSIMEEVLIPAFYDSTGTLIASCIWEGGDSVNKLTVNNGKVHWEDIDI